MSYEPNWRSVRTHELPAWFDDAKLGVFLHWGLYSVPAWAPQVPDIQTILLRNGPAFLLRNNPYAEWYLNSLRIPGSPTQRHHAETYGTDFPYDGFVSRFDDAAEGADLDALAGVCRRSGARYVVLTTKHHDGFCLWPSSTLHPTKGHYNSRRDLVGGLTEAVRAEGMRMGLYYSGGYDWPVNGAVLRSAADVVLAVPQSPEYVAYVDAHLRELIDRYRPSVLWNDIAYPAGSDLAAIIAHYYDTVEDGVVNDRWTQGRIPGGAVGRGMVRIAGAALQGAWRFIPERRKQLALAAPRHADFTTPEYASHEEIVPKKWESTRGVGHSFGANRHERPEDIITTTELVRSFVDIVSKNGNLLIGIGPAPDGTVPDWQAAPLIGLGSWLETNGEAIFGSRPWSIPSARTSEGTEVRFTRGGESLYAVLLETPPTARVELWGVRVEGLAGLEVLGVGGVEWVEEAGRLTVRLPERMPSSPAVTLRLTPASALRPAEGS